MELLDPNRSFTVYRNQRLQTITYQDLFANRRVLICSVTRPLTDLGRQYIQHLIQKKHYYADHGVDDVYIINSADGKFVLARFEANHPELVALYDNDGKFVEYLKEKMNKQQSLNVLLRYWSYQALISDGELEKFYEQPTEKYIKNIVESGYKLNMGNHKLYATQPESVMLHRPQLRAPEQYYEESNISDKNLVTGAVLYYKLWPNKALESYLID